MGENSVRYFKWVNVLLVDVRDLVSKNQVGLTHLLQTEIPTEEPNNRGNSTVHFRIRILLYRKGKKKRNLRRRNTNTIMEKIQQNLRDIDRRFTNDTIARLQYRFGFRQ